MVKDKFYRDMTDSQLRVAHSEMKKNLRYGEGKWKEEYDMLVNVAAERGLNLEDVSLSSKIEMAKGYVEFGVRNEDPVEYVTNNGSKQKNKLVTKEISAVELLKEIKQYLMNTEDNAPQSELNEVVNDVLGMIDNFEKK